MLGETLAETGIFNRDYLSIWSTPTSPAPATTAPLWTTMMFEAFLRNSNATVPAPSAAEMSL
jgi:asparagine synthase (glutamine-hydrolysing)